MQETCWQLLEEEILLLRSVYCEAGEFLAYSVPIDSTSSSTDSTLLECSAEGGVCLPRTLLEKETLSICIKLQIRAPSEINVTVECSFPKLYPKLEPPEITISSQNVPKECLMNLNARISSHCKALLPEPCLFDVLEEIKAELMKLESSDTPGLLQESVKAQFALTTATETSHDELYIAKLDHMRNEQKYLKLLRSWAKELGVTGKIVKAGSRNITVVLLGKNRAIAEFARRWRTQNVDVDSHGKPCKEKMMTVLCQQAIQVEKKSDGLVLVECPNPGAVHEQFDDLQVKERLKALMS